MPIISMKSRVCIAMVAGLAGLSAGARADNLPAAFQTTGQSVAMTLHAEGVQIYECVPADTGDLMWKFREPLATLLEDHKTVGRHFAGPGWQLTDGSGVTGKVVAQVAGQTADDIPWLKLDVTSHLGSGALSAAVAVQRINTHGGVLTGKCDKAGALHLQPYSADYVFLKD